ncbi:hypothetical protein [Oerskovia rustica]|uniref:Uncharacterized protein n=1 Tax=Oerskovia rustica TaxID=2762237 RepID=A0ABR8RP85_9CELL|nr:hypothetical protein [Oerskovia rustica]MBD7949609.1 hypothetical protein [Oerskovia rustica]
MTAPTSPKPHTPADPNDLRTALTKLAEDLARQPLPPIEPRQVGHAAARREIAERLRALLAAHPAQPQAGSLVEYRDAVARNRSAASWMRDDFLTDMDEWLTTHPAPVSDTRREDVAVGELAPGDQVMFPGSVYRAVRSTEYVGLSPNMIVTFEDGSHITWTAATRVERIPAPPVDDGGWTVADWEEWAGEVAATLPEDCDGDEAQTEIIAQFVRRAAAPPVVDEAAIADVISMHLGGYLPDGNINRLTAEIAARLRGVTHG